jgi:spermidine/putrescine transport system permease protein
MTTKTLPATSATPRLSSQRRLAVRLGQYALGANAALLFGFLYLPVLILIIFSFNSTRSVAVFASFSLEWYNALFQNDELLLAARSSLIIGLISTVASTAIGTLTALALDRYRFRGRTAFDANLYLPIVIPEIVMGISLLLFFNQALFPLIQAVTGLHFSTGLVTITLSHIAFNIPFVYIIVRARLADFNRTLEEAAQDLGADEWRTFRRVTLPLLMPGIIGGALMAFTLSLDDYLITAFTKGVGSNTMPLYIYSVVRKGVTPEINALSTALLVGSMGLVGLSLTAQSGGPTLTRGMGLGAALGAMGFALVRAAGVLMAEAPVWNLGWLVLLPLGVWMARVLPAWWVDLRESNAAGRWLAWFSLVLAGVAAFISLSLLFA